MWKKLLILFFIFLVISLLQNSFFSHYSFFGANINLIFCLFFVLIFFSAQVGPASGWENFIYAVIAGLFLDIFSVTYFGSSIVLLIVLGFLLKWVQLLLKNRNDDYPFAYFLPLFILSILAYNLINSGMGNVFSVIYNTLFASVLFYFYKKHIKSVNA